MYSSIVLRYTQFIFLTRSLKMITLKFVSFFLTLNMVTCLKVLWIGKIQKLGAL